MPAARADMRIGESSLSLPLFEFLEDDVERHHLGERGGVAGGIGAGGEQHLAVPGIHRNGREFRIGFGLSN
jgi:hypothetical protein